MSAHAGDSPFSVSDIAGTAVVINFPYTGADIDRISGIIASSRDQPLDILIDLRDPEWDWRDESHPMQADDMFRIFSAISDSAHRWQSIHILADNWGPIHAFLALSSSLSYLPMLSSLALSRCNAYFGIAGSKFEPEELKRPLELFGENLSVPNLRHASFAGVHVNWSYFRLKNLLSLELKYLATDVVPSMNEFLGIIRASPNLETLSLVACTPRRDGGSMSNEFRRVALRFPALKRFNFGWAQVNEGVELLSIFNLPAVEELSLEDVTSSLYNLNSQDSSPILDRLVRLDDPDLSNPSRACYSLSGLRKLSLEAVHVSPTALGGLLQRTVHLEDIEFSGIQDEALIRLFCIRELCPRLKRLGVRFSEEFADSITKSLRVVDAARTTLSVEVMDAKAPSGPEDLAQISEMDEDSD